jgi:gas vesicle protein
MSANNRNSFLWFLAGLGLGAVTVALSAPKSGVETRKALRSKAQRSLDRLSHHASRVREQTSHWANRSRDFLNRRGNQAKQGELAWNTVDAVKDSAGRKGTAESPSHLGDAEKRAV